MAADLNKHYVVELIGLPGAGKSILGFETIQLLKNDQYSCYNYDQIFKNSVIVTNKWLKSLLYYLKNFNLFFYLILYTLSSSPPDLAIKRYNLGRFIELLKLIVILDLSRKKIEQPSLMIFDQGIVQCLWSITSMGGQIKKDILKKSISTKKHVFPDIIIFVDIEPSTAVQRIAKRNSKCVFDHLEPAQTWNLFVLQRNNYKAILEGVTDVINIPVLTVNGNDSIKDNTHVITHYLKKIIKG